MSLYTYNTARMLSVTHGVVSPTIQDCKPTTAQFFSPRYPFDAYCCHIGTAIKHPVPDRVKPS